MNEEREARKVPERYVAFLKRQARPASVSVDGVSVDVFPGVFHPATDALLLAAHLKSGE